MSADWATTKGSHKRSTATAENPGILNNTQAPLLISDFHSQVGCLQKIYSPWVYFTHL